MRLALLLLVLFAAVSMPVTAAQADQMTVFTCHDPAGNAVGNNGWTVARTGADFMTAIDTCGAGGHGDLVLEVGANPGGYQNGERTEWVFNAPSWASIASYSLQIAGSYGMPYAGAGEGQAFVDASDESDPVYDYRNLDGGSLGASTISRIPPDAVSSISVNASCDGATGACPAGVPISDIAVSSAAVVLNDSTVPTVSDLGGSLVSNASVRGIGEVVFNAADSGPGVYSGQLVVEGQSEPVVILNSNNGWCENLGQTSNGTRSFAHPDPCAQSTSGSLTFDTTGLPDGQHTLKLVVDDASGNATTAYDATITTENAPANSSPPAIVSPGQLVVGASLSAARGAWSAPAGAGSITYAYEWQDCNSEGNGCQAIPGAQNSAYTPAPSDVGHTLRALVAAADSDGSSSAASPASSVVLSASGSLGALPGPGTSPSTSVDTPNGRNASESAVVHLGVGHAISRSFTQRAFKLSGRLTDSQGHPIAGATLDVLQQTAGTSAAQLIEQAQSSASGAFTSAVPAGPSRMIAVAYRAFASDASYAAEANVEESVGAGLRLHITPRATTPSGTVILSGRVAGPIPHQGTIVELLVHYRGHWEPFRTPRTGPDGRFHVRYQFEGAIGRFPFRAEVRAGQAGFPFADGYSRTVDVTTG